MATVKISYAASQTLNCTIAALSSSSTAARGSAVIDNTTNLYDDAILYVAVKTSGTAIGQDKSVYVYLYGSENGTNYEGSGSENVGSDAAVFVENPTDLRGPIVIACPGTTRQYGVASSVAQFWGGRMPRKWGFVVRNSTNNPLDPTESNHIKSFTGITYTVI